MKNGFWTVWPYLWIHWFKLSLVGLNENVFWIQNFFKNRFYWLEMYVFFVDGTKPLAETIFTYYQLRSMASTWEQYRIWILKQIIATTPRRLCVNCNFCHKPMSGNNDFLVLLFSCLKVCCIYDAIPFTYVIQFSTLLITRRHII